MVDENLGYANLTWDQAIKDKIYRQIKLKSTQRDI